MASSPQSRGETSWAGSSLVWRGAPCGSCWKRSRRNPPGGDLDLATREMLNAGSLLSERTVNAKSILLTYNGEWGEMGGEKQFPPNAGYGVVVEQLKAGTAAQELWADLQAFVEELSESCGADVWSFSLELCTRTWEREKLARVHAHVFLASASKKIRTRSMEKLAFRDSWPVRSGDAIMRARVRARVNDAGDFYCQIAKRGSLWNKGSRKMFVDFAVNP